MVQSIRYDENVKNIGNTRPNGKNKLLLKPYKIDFCVATKVTIPSGIATKNPIIKEETMISNI